MLILNPRKMYSGYAEIFSLEQLYTIILGQSLCHVAPLYHIRQHRRQDVTVTGEEKCASPSVLGGGDEREFFGNNEF